MIRERIVVVGAGPAGIGAALTLGNDCTVLEQGAALDVEEWEIVAGNPARHIGSRLDVEYERRS